MINVSHPVDNKTLCTRPEYRYGGCYWAENIPPLQAYVYGVTPETMKNRGEMKIIPHTSYFAVSY